jgi:hypothetical protein
LWEPELEPEFKLRLGIEFSGGPKNRRRLETREQNQDTHCGGGY